MTLKKMQLLLGPVAFLAGVLYLFLWIMGSRSSLFYLFSGIGYTGLGIGLSIVSWLKKKESID